MPAYTQNKRSTKVPLRLVLIVPFAIQLVLVVGLVGYLSFLNGQRAVNNVAHQLRSEITERIEEHLRLFLGTPHQINRMNADAVRRSSPDVGDQTAWARYFWEQIQVFDSVTSVYFGNPDGGLVDAGREGADGSLYVIVTDEFSRGAFRKYATDDHGNPTELLTTIPDFDARTRSWYADAVEKGDATWSDVYILFTGQDMAIAASRPVYDEQQNLLGVVSSDIFVSHIGDFLRHLKIGETGLSFIVERSGLLVASSTDENPFTDPDRGAVQRRLYAGESTTPTIRHTAQFLTEQFDDYGNIVGAQQLEFEIDGERQFLQVAPVRDEYGIDWLVVVVIPESDFMTQIKASNRITAFLVGIALIVAIVVGIVTAQWITKPILHLNVSTQALTEGEWDQTIGEAWISEIGDLARSFNMMVRQLKQTLESLTAEVTERAQAEASLRESEEKYRSLIEQSNDAIYLLYENRFEIINPRFAELFGVTAEETRARDFHFMSLVAPKSRPFIEERLAKQIRGQGSDMRYEFTAQDKAGHEIEVEVSVSHITYRGGIATQGVLRDVTERVRAREALRESNRRLEETLAELQETQERMLRQERLAAVGRLAAGIAHDFNNILASVALYAQMLLRVDTLSPTVHKRLAVIAGQADRGAELVQQILDFGRRTVMERQLLVVDVFLKEVVELLRHALPENVRIHLSFTPGVYVIHADSARIQQVIVNLALNARDAMPDGGDIRITLARIENAEIHCVDCGQVIGGDWVRVEVRDNGSGISSEALPHIFEPFYTTRTPIGHGLGLAQVYGIMMQHGGHIEVETEIGRGTTFKLYWPALSMPQPEQPEPAAHKAVSGAGQTILVVEDNTTMRTALADALDMLGYRVLLAANGQEALKVCKEYGDTVALVLGDWMMGSTGGLELVQALESQPIPAKVLMLTSHPLSEETKQAVSNRVVGWILKPPSLEHLAETVAWALDEYE